MRNHLKEIISKLSSLHIKPIFWIILVCIAFLICFTHIYNDILAVGKCSYDIWDYIFSGRLLEFYSTRQHSEPVLFYVYKQRGFYPVIAQYILALWQLPVWLIGRISGEYLFNSIGSMVWLKGLLLLCYIFSGYKVYRIVRKIKNDEGIAIYAMWFFLSSSIIFLNTFVASQIEIITVAFMLVGIEALSGFGQGSSAYMDWKSQIAGCFQC